MMIIMVVMLMMVMVVMMALFVFFFWTLHARRLCRDGGGGAFAFGDAFSLAMVVITFLGNL